MNQTVSIPTDPVVEPMTYKAVVEFKAMDEAMLKEFSSACDAYEELRAKQAALQKQLATEPIDVQVGAISAVGAELDAIGALGAHGTIATPTIG